MKQNKAVTSMVILAAVGAMTTQLAFAEDTQPAQAVKKTKKKKKSGSKATASGKEEAASISNTPGAFAPAADKAKAKAAENAAPGAAGMAGDLGTTPAVNGISNTSVASSPWSKVNLSYFGLYGGAPLSNLGSPYQPNKDGVDSTSPANLESLVHGAYKLNDRFKIGSELHFNYNPGGAGITMLDPTLRLTDGNTLQVGKLKSKGYLRFYIPVAAESTNTKQIAKFRFLQDTNYEISGSRFTLGAYSYLQPAAYQDASSDAAKKKLLTAYLGPYVNYQVTKKIAVGVLYEMAASHTAKSAGFNNDGTDLEPNVNVDITENFSVNPFINLYTGDKVNADNSGFGVIVTGKFL